MTVTTQTVYNVWAGDYPRRYESIVIDENQALVPGSVIGKKTIAAGTAVVGGSNTGDGVLSAFALAAGGPAKLGNYSVICVSAVTNSGTFDVKDPEGVLIGQIVIPVSSNITFTGGGITFNLADGATDFAVDDEFTLPVEAGNGRGVLLDKAAVDGSQLWRGVVVQTITTGSAETATTPIAISGDFLSQGLVFASGTVVADVYDAARDLNCYIHTSYAAENMEVN